MKTTTLRSLLTAALVLAWGTDAALSQNENASFQQKQKAFDATANKTGMMDNALRAISAETGVPQNQLQAMRQKHPNAGAAWILSAAVMADQTKQPAETFLQKRLSGKNWPTIAAENHVPLQTLDQRLDNVQRALNNPQQTAATSTNPRTTAAPATTSATAGRIEQKAAALNQMAQSSGNTDAALHAIAVETGVPKDQVQTLQKNHPDAGPGGILIASVLADETKQPPETFLQTHASGKNWETIASDNHVSLDKFDTRFNHVQRYLGTSSGSLAPTGR